jgi:hypothetical protein
MWVTPCTERISGTRGSELAFICCDSATAKKCLTYNPMSCLPCTRVWLTNLDLTQEPASGFDVLPRAEATKPKAALRDSSA